MTLLYPNQVQIRNSDNVLRSQNQAGEIVGNEQVRLPLSNSSNSSYCPYWAPEDVPTVLASDINGEPPKTSNSPLSIPENKSDDSHLLELLPPFEFQNSAMSHEKDTLQMLPEISAYPDQTKNDPKIDQISTHSASCTKQELDFTETNVDHNYHISSHPELNLNTGKLPMSSSIITSLAIQHTNAPVYHQRTSNNIITSTTKNLPKSIDVVSFHSSQFSPQASDLDTDIGFSSPSESFSSNDDYSCTDSPCLRRPYPRTTVTNMNTSIQTPCTYIPQRQNWRYIPQDCYGSFANVCQMQPHENNQNWAPPIEEHVNYYYDNNGNVSWIQQTNQYVQSGIIPHEVAQPTYPQNVSYAPSFYDPDMNNAQFLKVANNTHQQFSVPTTNVILQQPFTTTWTPHYTISYA